MRLCELMISFEKSIIPLDLIYNDEILGDFVRTIQIDSPYQQLIMEGVITESVIDEKLSVNFTIEGFFHYLLGEIISKESINKDYNYFVDLIENNNLNGIKEGVENCLITDVYNGGINRIIELVDTNNSAILKITEYPISCAFIKPTK